MKSSDPPDETSVLSRDSLAAFQSRLAGSTDAFIAEHGRWLNRTASALCRRFRIPEHEREDVVQETYLRLLEPRFERFNSARGTARNYLRGVVLNAINVAARNRRRDDEGLRPTNGDLTLSVADVQWLQPFQDIEAQSDLSRLLRYADPVASGAIGLMCTDGVSQRDAANAMGVSESMVSRSMSRFTERARAAA